MDIPDLPTALAMLDAMTPEQFAENIRNVRNSTAQRMAINAAARFGIIPQDIVDVMLGDLPPEQIAAFFYSEQGKAARDAALDATATGTDGISGTN